MALTADFEILVSFFSVVGEHFHLAGGFTWIDDQSHSFAYRRRPWANRRPKASNWRRSTKSCRSATPTCPAPEVRRKPSHLMSRPPWKPQSSLRPFCPMKLLPQPPAQCLQVRHLWTKIWEISENSFAYSSFIYIFNWTWPQADFHLNGPKIVRNSNDDTWRSFAYRASFAYLDSGEPDEDGGQQQIDAPHPVESTSAGLRETAAVVSAILPLCLYLLSS